MKLKEKCWDIDIYILLLYVETRSLKIKLLCSTDMNCLYGSLSIISSFMPLKNDIISFQILFKT